LAKPSVEERLRIISALLPQHEDLRDPLELCEKILQIQLGIEVAHATGMKASLCDRIAVDLQQKTLEAKRPMVHFLDPSTFDFDALSHAAREIVDVLIDRNADGASLRRLVSFVGRRKENLLKLVEATLKEDIVSIRTAAEELGIQPSLILFIVSALIQPFLEEIATKIDPSLLDEWWRADCPVCGRIPIVAKVRDRKRYLVCVFCGTEYLSDRFLCVHCGNKDPYSLKHLIIDGQPAYEIDYCTSCNHYIKVIDEANLKEDIPKGLEDILTLDLDLVAKKADLVRD